MSTAKLIVNDKEYEFPLIIGTEGEVGIDMTALRAKADVLAYDPGYGNVASSKSAITFINGEKGILRYRGYPTEEIARQADFVEVCYLLYYGVLPTRAELDYFREQLWRHSHIHEDMKKFFERYPPSAHPMTIFSSMIASLDAFYSNSDEPDLATRMTQLIAKAKTIAAASYRRSIGRAYIYPRRDLSYPADFLNMMFAFPGEPHDVPKVTEEALNLLLILHADHEQNCSASTVRMVASSQANLFLSISAGISALSGHLHGGANQKVIQMLEMIRQDGGNYKKYVERAKDRTSDFRLFGFGHRVYEDYDPRALILKESADRLLEELGINDPLLEIAKKLEETALKDPYFVDRNLYPNVDFYSGIIYRAIGIPTNMFTVMFALGRMPGWIAHWKEFQEDPDFRIQRPRQIYVGETKRPFIPIHMR